jgi:hypothetical protein
MATPIAAASQAATARLSEYFDGSFRERAGRGLDTQPVHANHGEDADAYRVSKA